MEGEPASAKDRVLLAYAPHLVLDGAEVAATVVGAAEIVVCVADHSGCHRPTSLESGHRRAAPGPGGPGSGHRARARRAGT